MGQNQIYATNPIFKVLVYFGGFRGFLSFVDDEDKKNRGSMVHWPFFLGFACIK